MVSRRATCMPYCSYACHCNAYRTCSRLSPVTESESHQQMESLWPSFAAKCVGISRKLWQILTWNGSKVIKRRQVVVASVDNYWAGFRSLLIIYSGKPLYLSNGCALRHWLASRCYILLLQGLFKAFREKQSCPFESGRIHHPKWHCPN